MFWVVTLTMSVLMFSASGCSLEANISDLNQQVLPAPAAVRHDKDYQNTELAVSGHYQVQGQIAETTERRNSGNYVVEGVIAYE
ncbi:hypothetical protein AB1A79_03330 [Bdellovibrio bacteriovorus]|uniref:Uncharacterized protein n=2 Tax=Bdellovibrio bacteriovorus TaxID=959 RepID=Q6MPW4_BDEBA|nr:hypothetical protein [Bdellovibrio bacteriovorus]AHZ86792.1 hypothetical protein EP01_17890 [Bdellovibrio bacteriovorus]BEV67232.1 hypothetical protein Bb109J_c0652 [Bdellovibrio bacteriovorus]CAE78683.1 hypothetical protein predicted by Glimmer/Critica [Bdellovibrio bacteriovorus HD100]